MRDVDGMGSESWQRSQAEGNQVEAKNALILCVLIFWGMNEKVWPGG